MKDHIKNACFRKTLLITLLLIILKYTKYDYLEKENGEKPNCNSNISPPSLLRTYFDVYVNSKNKGVKELKKLLKNVTISNDYLCTVKKVDINVYNKICGNKVSKIILSNERKYGENDLKKKCINTGSSSRTFGEEEKREALFTNYEKRNVYKNSSLLEDFDENRNTNKNFLFGLFDIIAKIKKIIIDTSNKIISMCLFNTGNHEENVFYIKNNKGYDELQNSNFYNYYENSNINIYSINKELYGYNEEYASKYLYSFIDISSDNLNINFHQKGVQGEDGNIAPEIFKNKNVHNLSKDKKYGSHRKIDDGNKSNWGVSNDKTEKYILETETNRNTNFKNGQFLKVVSEYFWKKSEKWNESKINQSKKLHKKNDEMIHRLIGRILAENDHEYENLSLSPDRDRERARERENERKEEIEWERHRNKNHIKYSAAEERLLLIIRERNGDPKSDNSDKSGVTVLEFSRLPPKKRRRACTILAENESENSSKDSNNDSKASDNKSNSSDESNDKSKDYSPASPATGDVAECRINIPSILIEGKDPESASSDDKSNSSGESNDKSKDYSPASPTPDDTPEDKINRPSRIIAEKESEDKSEDKDNDKNKEQDKEYNSSDKNNGESKEYDTASQPAQDIPEGKINRPSRLIAEKESENKSENKNSDNKNNSSDKSDNDPLDYSPASPAPADIPEGKINRPSRLIAEKESENKSDNKDKNNDKNKEQHKETNSSDKCDNDPLYYSPASPAPADIPEGKINRPSRLIAEKESEDKNEDKNEGQNKDQDKETNSSDKNNDESKEYDPDSQPAEDIPEGKINRPSRLIAEKESEDKNESQNKGQDKETNSSDKNNEAPIDYSPASPAPADTPEGKINRPSRLIAEKESEDKNESQNKGQDKETNSSDKSDNDPLDYSPASPAPADTPEGKINRPSRLIAEKESENKSEDRDKDKNKNQDKETNSSDKNNGESKEYDPASQPAEDIPEGKINRPSRIIAEKESEDKSNNKNEGQNKDQDKETNSSDKINGESKEYDPASPPAQDIPEGKINRPSRLIAEKESENKSEDKDKDKDKNKEQDKESNSSDNNNDESKDDSPASPPPSDTPNGEINRPSRLIAEQELENKENVKYVKQYKPYNPSSNNNDISKYYSSVSSPQSDASEGKTSKPPRLFAEIESENKGDDKDKDKNREQHKESNSSDNNNDESKDDSPASPPPSDTPNGEINRPSRLIAEQEWENKENVKHVKQYKPYKTYNPSNNNNDISKYYSFVSSPQSDASEGKTSKPPRLFAEIESEDKNEGQNNDQDKETNSSDNNNDDSKYDSPASPPPSDTPDGKTNRPSRLIAEKESENKSEDNDNDKNKEQDKESNSSDNNNDDSKYDSPASPPPSDTPNGKINRPSRLIAENELEYKDNEQGKEQFLKKNEVNKSQNASYKSIVVENGQKGNRDEEKKSMFENIKKKKEKYRKKYYAYDIIETMEALSSLSDEEYYTNDGAASRAKTSSILGKYLRQPIASNKYLDINLFFDEKPYRYRKGNYYFINPFPYSIIKMKKNEGLAYSEKIKYDGVYCYSLSFNNNSSLEYAIESSFRNIKPIEEIVPGTLTGFKSDDGYQKMLTPMFVEEDMFLHCTFNNEPNEIENRIASFPVKIFLKKNLNKTKGCSFQINKHDSIYKEYAERESFLSKKIILNDENNSNECDITATNEIIGFQCGPPYKHYTNNSNTSYMDKIFFNHVNNEDIKAGEYFKVEPAHCFEEVNTNEHIEDVAPDSFPFPNFEMINGGLKSHHTRYLKLNIRDPNIAISCYCNYYNNGKIIYSGIMTINGKKNYNGQSDSIYSAQDINKANDNAKQTGHKQNKINKMENYNDYKYFLNLLSYYNPYFMLYRKQPEDIGKKDFAYDSKHRNKNNDEFLKKIKSKLANLKFSDNDKYIHGMDDNLRYKYDNRHSSVYPISDYDSESHFDSERLSDSYGDTFNDDYISPNSNSYYGENTYNSDDLFSNYDDANIESEYEELEPLQDNVSFQDNKSYEDKTQSIVVINKSKNVNVYIPKNKIKNKSKHIKDNEDIEDKKTKDALLKYLLLTYEETPDKNEKLNTKLKLFKEYFPSSSKNNIFIEEKENDNTSNKIKNACDIKEESIEPLNEKQSNNEIEVSENDFTLDHNKSYNHDNANSNNHEGGITDGQINESIPNMIMNKILHDLFGHSEDDGNKEGNPKKDKKTHQTKINTIENKDEGKEDLTEKTNELTEGENIFQKIK
ncbi:6-cysteine protein liver specific protein 2, putative [Plasmodium vinckei brucechwatti]|uniref:6-cysteine protein liver specific protein 2, putative n=1 Tax=Plasmodium vinckei brucechwatti TaxID=119398 RepID=A0A6V7S192_PLAVN|nr:6-cysteine protein liver specific protein 2, putative [Plasmodium vinckei brucechwatti]